MKVVLYSWRQKIKQHHMRLAVIIGSAILGIALLVVLNLGYIFNWGWTGLGIYIPPTKVSNFQRGKTLWDWLQLLIVPLVLAVGGFWLSQLQKTIEQRRTTDNQREAALEAYIDKISELLIKEHLGERTEDGKLKPEYEQVRKIARVRTITVLIQLDARRISYIFTFLREAGLMSTTPNDNVVSLRDADLHAVNWSQANLYQAYLSRTNLSRANLSKANLSEARLRGASLSGADLSGAELSRTNFSGADLSGADLRGAYLSRADLREVYLKKGNLSEAYLSGAYLNEADLSGSDLKGAYLKGANLSGADLRGADLSGADLSEADLRGAKVTEEQLAKARSLQGALIPDGLKHP